MLLRFCSAREYLRANSVIFYSASFPFDLILEMFIRRPVNYYYRHYFACAPY